MFFKKNISLLLCGIMFLPITNFINLKSENTFQILNQAPSRKAWIINFFQYLTTKKFLVFSDDFEIDNLKHGDLEKIKPFADNWLQESISFFNNDIYFFQTSYFYYQIINGLKLRGFKKSIDGKSLQLYYWFYGEPSYKINRDIIANFDIFNNKKSFFIDFLNNELKNNIFKFKELSFENLTHNFQEWNKTRNDFFWKTNSLRIAFESQINDLIIKLNENFKTRISKENNLLFYSWNKLENNFKGELTFIYRRFDIKLNVPFEFVNFFDTDLQSDALKNEDDLMYQEFGFKRNAAHEYDYLWELSSVDFINLDAIDIYLELSFIVNQIKRRILDIWNDFLIKNDIIGRFDSVNDDFLFNQLNSTNFKVKSHHDVYISFFTTQKQQMERIIKFVW